MESTNNASMKTPTELNMLLAFSVLFCIFYFFPSKHFVSTTTWFCIGSLVILSLMGITFAFKNVIRTSMNLSFKNILMYVLLPFTSVIIVPILKTVVNRKYQEYVQKTKQTIQPIETISGITTSLLLLQIYLLYSLYKDFIQQKSYTLMKPSMLFILFVINLSLTMYNYVVVHKFITDG